MDVTPDRHTWWYQGMQRIYRNAVVRHLRTALREEYPKDWEDVLVRPFAREWPTIVERAQRGFRQFLLRGLEKVNGEWSLICTGHNLLKLFRFGVNLHRKARVDGPAQRIRNFA